MYSIWRIVSLAVAREQSKPLIPVYETANADDSQRAGYRCLFPPRPADPKLFSRGAIFCLFEGETL